MAVAISLHASGPNLLTGRSTQKQSCIVNWKVECLFVCKDSLTAHIKKGKERQVWQYSCNRAASRWIHEVHCVMSNQSKEISEVVKNIYFLRCAKPQQT
jgi:hypothetical protein